MLAVTATCLAALAAPAKAAPPAAAPAAPSAAAQDLARVLFSKEQWTAAVQQLSGIVQRNLEGHPGRKLQYPADLPTRIRTEVEGVIPYDELVNVHAKELSASLTEPELKELVAFYGTPVGKKWMQAQPRVTDSVNGETQRRLQQKMPDVMKKLGGLAKAPEPAKDAAPAKKDAAPAKKDAAPAKKDAAPAKTPAK
jgi:hypothetical protein